MKKSEDIVEQKKCKINGCRGKNFNHGLCYKHSPIKEKLLLNRTIDRKTGCWNFIRNKASIYPCVEFKGHHRVVHRVSAHLWKSFDLNSKLLVCHHCDNPRCFNPAHLWIGTQRENIGDCIQKGRRASHCSPGGKNIYAQGENHPSCKLTKRDVKKIRRLYNHISSRKIAKMFNISYHSAWAIATKKYWKHV